MNDETVQKKRQHRTSQLDKIYRTPTSQLSLDDFIHWATGFDGMSRIEGLDAFVAVYLGNRTATTEPKRGRPTDREVNTAVYLLRCKQLGFTFQELSQVEEGMVFDVLSESDNDENGDYCEVATQEDMETGDQYYELLFRL